MAPEDKTQEAWAEIDRKARAFYRVMSTPLSNTHPLRRHVTAFGELYRVILQETGATSRDERRVAVAALADVAAALSHLANLHERKYSGEDEATAEHRVAEARWVIEQFAGPEGSVQSPLPPPPCE